MKRLLFEKEPGKRNHTGTRKEVNAKAGKRGGEMRGVRRISGFLAVSPHQA